MSVRYIEEDTPQGRVPVCDKQATIRGMMKSNLSELHQQG